MALALPISGHKPPYEQPPESKRWYPPAIRANQKSYPYERTMEQDQTTKNTRHQGLILLGDYCCRQEWVLYCRCRFGFVWFLSDKFPPRTPSFYQIRGVPSLRARNRGKGGEFRIGRSIYPDEDGF